MSKCSLVISRVCAELQQDMNSLKVLASLKENVFVHHKQSCSFDVDWTTGTQNLELRFDFAGGEFSVPAISPIRHRRPRRHGPLAPRALTSAPLSSKSCTIFS
jgi:hypothetical protein